MGMKSKINDFHNPRTNQVLELIITYHYIKIGGCVIIYTIVGNLVVDEMQRNLMGRTNNLLVCWLTSQYFSFYYRKIIGGVVIVDKNQRIKGTALEFVGFLRFIGMWLFITENPGTNQTKYFSDTPIEIFGSW